MNILVACEESQAVTIELRRLGHNAFSCDIQECSGGHPEWHIKGDVLNILNPTLLIGNDEFGIVFETMDGLIHDVQKWDMIIAFPPCTYLTAASAVRVFNKDHSIKDPERYQKGVEAATFFRAFLEADCPKIAIENPVMMKCFGLTKYNQIIEPFMFGDPWRKRTCLWLKNLPLLVPADIVEPQGLWVGSTCANRDPSVYTRYALNSIRDSKRRAKTFPGIAKAMAEQWAGQADDGGVNDVHM